MRHLIITLLLSSVSIGCSFAQTGHVSGKITDVHGHPLAAVNIVLLNAKDSALYKAGYTDDAGKFLLGPVNNGGYILKAILPGYQNYTRGPLYVKGDDLDLQVISMEEKSTALKQVTVVAQKPFIEVHPDKLVVNVENSIVSAGSSVMDVLSRSPGVTIDQNDNISLKGRQGVNVMINGKIQPISAQDLANLLKSMPSESVDKIEIISNPSAKYDAAGTAGIINIKTRKDQRIGFNGSINATYAQGVYPKAIGGFNLNYRNKKFNFFASYNYSYRKTINYLKLTRNFYNNGRFDGAYIQDNNLVFPFNTHAATAGMDYTLSRRTTAGFVLSGHENQFHPGGFNVSNVLDSNHINSSYFTTANQSRDKWYDYAANVNLRHTFDTLGKELTVDADYADYRNQTYQLFTTRYYSLSALPSLPTYILYGDLSGVTQIRSLKADYVNPLKNNGRFEAGFKISYVTANNQPRFYDRSSGTDIFDSTKSDHFIYTEQINALYLNLSKDWTKWSAQLGLRAEQTIATGNQVITDSIFKQNYTHLFPSLAVQRHLDKNDDLGLTLSRRIERPGYMQLNPFKFFLDPTTYKAGNPYLMPALSYNAELSYTYKQRLITTLSYSITNDPITEVLVPSETENKVTIQTERNLSRMLYYGISGSYNIPVTKWWNDVTNVNAYYSKYQGYLAGTYLDKGKPTFDVNTVNSFVLPQSWSAELSLNYQAAQVYGYMNLRPNWMLNAGVQKNLLDKKITIRLNATDIFWTGNLRATSYFTSYVETFNVHRDTRQVSLAFIYRFGKHTIPAVHRHSGGAEDEKRRANAEGA